MRFRTIKALVHTCILAAGAGKERGKAISPLVPVYVSHSESQRSLEKPIETAILLSLVGVESIVANQWPTLLQDNALRANILWDSEWAPWLSQSLLGLPKVSIAHLKGLFPPRPVSNWQATWENSSSHSEDRQ